MQTLIYMSLNILLAAQPHSLILLHRTVAPIHPNNCKFDFYMSCHEAKSYMINFQSPNDVYVFLVVFLASNRSAIT